jgi:hypothetical protein
MVGSPVLTKGSVVTFEEYTVVNEGDLYDEIQSYADVDMFGGQVTDRWVAHRRPAGGTVNMYDGYVQNFSVTDGATLNIFGGTINATLYLTGGTVNIRGGLICEGHYEPGEDYYGRIMTDGVFFLPINVYGYNLTKSSIGGFWGGGYIEGNWLDNTPFHIDLDDYFSSPTYTTYDQVLLHEIPEPTTLLLLAFATVMLRRK